LLDSFSISPHNKIIGSLLDDDSYEDNSVWDDDDESDHDDDNNNNIKNENRNDDINENRVKSELYETLHSACDKDDNTMDSKSFTSADSKWR